MPIDLFEACGDYHEAEQARHQIDVSFDQLALIPAAETEFAYAFSRCHSAVEFGALKQAKNGPPRRQLLPDAMLKSPPSERWMSGLSRTPGKRVYGESRTEGSNPSLSATPAHSLVAILQDAGKNTTSTLIAPGALF